MTIQFKSQNFSTKDLFRTKKSPSSAPHDVPGLYDAFGTDEFDELYVRYESDESIPRKSIGAQELFLDLLKERAETGRLYIMNIDHCNSHSSFTDKVEMSNLCQEITLPTKPLQHIDDENGEIALCILSAVNVGKIRDLEDLQVLCDLAVRSLDELIDFQNYPIRAAEIATKARRSLGIGYIGLAHFLAKQGFNYSDQGAWDAVHKLTEAFQYYLISATVDLAKEKGACEYSSRTKYGNGILPIDTYKHDVDEIVPNEFTMIGRILDFGSKNTEYGTQHCLLRCHRRAVPLCQTQQMELNHLEGICPLRRAKKDRSNRLFLSMQLLRTITRSSGIWSLIGVTSILLLLCRSFLTKQSAETGVTIQPSIQTMKSPSQ